MAEITGTDLIAPNGPIQPTFFPTSALPVGVNLSGLMDAYVTRAYADARVSTLTSETAKNTGAFSLAAYLALMDVYGRMLTEPTSVNIAEKGSHGYTKDQRDGIKALADQYLADLDALIPVPIPADAQRPTSARLHLSFF